MKRRLAALALLLDWMRCARTAGHALVVRNLPAGLASLAALYPMPFKATYAASKRFLLDFSLALAEELRRRGSPVLCIGPSGRGSLPVPRLPELLSPIVSVIPGQLLAFHAARARGLDPDAPRGLTKVTETR